MADQKQDMPKITVLYFVLKKTNSKFGFPSRGPHSSCHSPPLLKSGLQSSCFWSTWGLSRWVLRSGPSALSGPFSIRSRLFCQMGEKQVPLTG